jgi:hypothetical protein
MVRWRYCRGHAVAKYDKTVAFLDNLKLSLDALKEYVEQNPYAKYSTEIETQLQKIRLPLERLEKYM